MANDIFCDTVLKMKGRLAEKGSWRDIILTHKKYLFSHLYPHHQQDSRNLLTGEERAGDTAPAPGWQFHLIPEKQTPTANSVSAPGRSSPSLQQSYPSHQLHVKAKSGQKTCIILHPQLPALLFLFILK